MSIRVNRIWLDYDWVQTHNHLTYEHKQNVELVNLISAINPPDFLVEVGKDEGPIFNSDGHGTIVREVGPYGVYYLSLRPRYVLTQIAVDPDDVFVDVRTDDDRLVYCFYNGTRRTSISISATIEEDVEGAARELSTGLNDPIWRQYFVRRALHKPGIQPLAEPREAFPEILTAAQVARYLAVEQKTIRNWTSQGKIPHKKAGTTVRYRKSEIDKALDAGTLGKSAHSAKARKTKR